MAMHPLSSFVAAFRSAFELLRNTCRLGRPGSSLSFPQALLRCIKSNDPDVCALGMYVEAVVVLNQNRHHSNPHVVTVTYCLF